MNEGETSNANVELSNNKLTQNKPIVNTNFMPENADYSLDVDQYTEEQYNNFGWVRYNDILTAAEYTTLLSRYADYKHNKDIYPTTRFGEAVIFSFDYPNILMYVKGKIRSPQITKILKIDPSLSEEMVREIKEEFLHNESRHLSLPYESIISFYGEEVFTVIKARNYASFREYIARKEGRSGEEGNRISGNEQDGRRSAKQNTETDRAGLSKSAFSMRENSDYSLDVDEVTEKRDFTQDMETLFKEFQEGVIDKEEYELRRDELFKKAGEVYGTKKQGESVTGKENFDNPVPKSVKKNTNITDKNKYYSTKGLDKYFTDNPLLLYVMGIVFFYYVWRYF